MAPMRIRKKYIKSKSKAGARMVLDFFRNWPNYSVFECGLLGGKHGSVLILAFLVTQDLSIGYIGNAVFKIALLLIIFASSILQAKKMLKKQLYGNFVR